MRIALDAMGTDPQLQQLWARATGPSAPATALFTRIDFVVA